jgi:hypothetical protein
MPRRRSVRTWVVLIAFQAGAASASDSNTAPSARVIAVSPRVDARSHEEGCRQYCASIRDTGCAVAAAYRDDPPFRTTGNLDCKVPLRGWDGAVRGFRIVPGAARIQCGINQVLLDDVISCACEPGKRWNGSACAEP